MAPLTRSVSVRCMDAFTRSKASGATPLAPIAEPREDRRLLLALKVGARCPPPLELAAKPPEDNEAAPLTELLEDGRALLALEAGARCPPALGPAAKLPEDNEAAPLTEPPEDGRALLALEAGARCPPALGPAAKPPEDNEAPLAEPFEDERVLLAPASEARARCPPMGFAGPEDSELPILIVSYIVCNGGDLNMRCGGLKYAVQY